MEWSNTEFRDPNGAENVVEIDNTERTEVINGAKFFFAESRLSCIPRTHSAPFPSLSLTMFSPHDRAFMRSGKPPLSLMRLHFCPLLLSSGFLSSLPFSSQNPTATFIVSSLPTDANFTLIGVTIDRLPLYSDEYLTVYGIRDFFDPSFQISTPLHEPTLDLLCASRINDSKLTGLDSPGRNAFDGAIKVMRTGGYSIMASVLAMQLIRFEYKTRTFTLSAPTDEVLLGRAGNVSELSSLFLRHVVPCKLARIDLANFIREPATPIYSQGFKIRVKEANRTMAINWVGIAHPELHRRDWIIGHGIQDILGTSRSQH